MANIASFHRMITLTNFFWQAAMALNILPVKDINLDSRNYTIQVIIVEKTLPKKSSKSNSQYQRFVLQDIEVIYQTIIILPTILTHKYIHL